MAYSLRSLVRILEQVMYPDQHYKNWVLDHAKIRQTQSLLEIATFMRNFFDTTSPLILDTMESLEDQIMETAGKAEDTLESHITEQILSNPEGQSFMISPPDLGEVLRSFEVAKQELINVKAADQRWGDVSRPVSSTYPDSLNMVVGMTDALDQLRSQLTARVLELNIIPIVGMGGLGKTTLARILYDEHSSGRSSHFDCCAWVTVSQSYDPKQILQKLINVIGKPLNELTQQDTAGLIVTLHKTLFGRRYLIVLDDIWSCRVWDDFQTAFPQDKKGSRIILTTRDNTVANYVNLNSYQMHVLSEDDSWKLLCGKVFGERSCPRDLEEAGKKIALKCGGLPLALQVISGLLSQSKISKDFWEHVVYNISLLMAKTNNHFAGIFSWSFVNLPHYLKPCFLYMGAFPEDHAIRASTITKLWSAEGFLYPVPDKSLEEAAEIHLDALVNRNLIYVHKRKANGKAESYGIHDLLRDLCYEKAQEKKLIYFKDSETGILQEDTLRLRRVLVQLSDDKKDEFGSLNLTSLARSFLLVGDQESNRFVSRLCFKSSLLRVLHAYPSTISEFHKGFLKLVNLRFLSLYNLRCVVPRNISVLRNLETLKVTTLKSIMILEELPQLRHLKFIDLEQRFYKRSFSVHENLHTLSWIPLETLTRRLLGNLPELRKLGIDGRYSSENVDLTCFKNLETLECKYGYPVDGYIFPNKTMFARSINKLTLTSYETTQPLLDAIGVLPNLQILEFEYVGFEKFTWEPCEDGFIQLHYLKFDNVELENWEASEDHFPVLRHLVFCNCRSITEIPKDIGKINTLEIIEVDECKTSLFESVKIILEEQSMFGNDLLQLHLGHSFEEEREGEEDEIKAMVKDNALLLDTFIFRSTTILPQGLKSLTLYYCAFSQTNLQAIGVLPELEYLEFFGCDFESLTWEPSKGEFCKLQCLNIIGHKLKNWLATESHFPVLRHLGFKFCFSLDEIPNRLGGIETLEILEVDQCHLHFFDSARRILEEQRQLGNTLLQLRLMCVFGKDDDEEREQEEDGHDEENEDISNEHLMTNQLRRRGYWKQRKQNPGY